MNYRVNSAKPFIKACLAIVGRVRMALPRAGSLIWAARVAIAVVVFVAVLKGISVVSMTPEERYFYRELQTRTVGSQKNQEILLASLTPFFWDKVRFLGPYGGRLPTRSIELNGNEYAIKSRTKVNLDNDGKWALAFVRGDSVVAIIRVRRLTLFPGPHQFLRGLVSEMPYEMLGRRTKIVVDSDYRFYLKEEN